MQMYPNEKLDLLMSFTCSDLFMGWGGVREVCGWMGGGGKGGGGEILTNNMQFFERNHHTNFSIMISKLCNPFFHKHRYHEILRLEGWLVGHSRRKCA